MSAMNEYLYLKWQYTYFKCRSIATKTTIQYLNRLITIFTDMYHFNSVWEWMNIVYITFNLEHRTRRQTGYITTRIHKKGSKHFGFARHVRKLVPPLSDPLVKFALTLHTTYNDLLPQFQSFQSTYKACTPLSDPVLFLCIDLTGKYRCLKILIFKEGIGVGNSQKRTEVNNLHQSNTTWICIEEKVTSHHDFELWDQTLSSSMACHGK